MSNPAKQKGTSFETLIVNLLKRSGFHRAFRPALTGIGDTGDINGVGKALPIPANFEAPEPYCLRVAPFRHVTFQCKNQRTLKLPEWMRATKAQAARLGADTVPVLVVKRSGAGAKSVGQNYAIMELDDMLKLLLEAGYQ